MSQVDEFLTAEDILEQDDLSGSLVEVVIPEWKKGNKPGKLMLRPMTAEQAIKFQKDFQIPQKRSETFIRMLAACACRPDGALLFTEADVAKLRSRNTAVYLRLQKRLGEINGMTQPERSLESVKAVLAECGIDSDTIEKVAKKWDATEGTEKND